MAHGVVDVQVDYWVLPALWVHRRILLLDCKLVTRSPTRLKLEASTWLAPLQVDRPDPEGQWHATCRSVETHSQTWSWGVTTAQAGCMLNDDDDWFPFLYHALMKSVEWCEIKLENNHPVQIFRLISVPTEPFLRHQISRIWSFGFRYLLAGKSYSECVAKCQI